MKTFHWEEIKRDGCIELHCFHTRHNKNFNTTRRFMSAFFAYLEDVLEAKKSFEKKHRRHVVNGGAWEPIEGAKWTFDNGKWRIDESQIRVVA